VTTVAPTAAPPDLLERASDAVPVAGAVIGAVSAVVLWARRWQRRRADDRKRFDLRDEALYLLVHTQHEMLGLVLVSPGAQQRERVAILRHDLDATRREMAAVLGKSLNDVSGRVMRAGDGE
jgi:hypothetical protein